MSSSYTLDFAQYSLTDGGTVGTFNQHNLSTIFHGDWKFEDISSTDTGGLTAWGKKIEIQSQSGTNWTIVRLSNKNGYNFNLDDFEYTTEGAHTYKVVNPSSQEYIVNTDSSEYGGSSNDVNTSTLDNSFSNISYVDFYSRAITGEFGAQTKWHLDDIDVTLAESTAPTISSFSPADDATAVATNSNIVLTFSEAVDVESGNIVIYNSSNNSAVETIDVTSGQVTGTGSTQITINPSSDLAEQTSYYVQIAATAFDDSASNSYAGISDTTSLSFTTADETNPSLSSSTPADNATAVATTSNIVLNFSEAVDVETGNIIIYKVSDDSVVETIDVTSGQVTGTGSTQITINPSNNLAEQTSYYVQIAATAFDDSSSNSYAGISNTTSLSFTTADETAPTFSSAATNTAGTKVILTYNEALSSTTAATSAFSVTSGGSSNSVSSVVISGSTIELTLTTTVKDDETVNFTYTDPSSGNDSYAIQDSSGNDAISLSSTSVTNNSTVASSSDSSGSSGSSGSSSSTPITDGVEVAQVNSSYVADSNGFSSVNGSAPVIISAYNIGQETTLDSIKDYGGTLHAGDNLAATASSYKYQGMLDVNGDGVFAAIFTNKSSKRWVTAKVDSTTGQIDFDDNGAGGGTRVVGIYADPLIAEGEQYGGFLSDGTTPAPAAFGATGSDRYVDLNGDGDFNDDNEDRLALNSQVRFQTDLENDNLSAKHAGDYDSDGVHEVYWKTNDGDVYLRSLMHADGNIRYANYQSEEQMRGYLTSNGDSSVISDIV